MRLTVATWNLYLGAEVELLLGATSAEDLAERAQVLMGQLARTDFTRTQFSAEVQTNWMPRALGSMMS